MNIYFTSRPNIGSKLIQWATGGDVSHCAIALGGSVYHTTEHGFEQIAFYDFDNKFKIVRSLSFDIPDDKALLAMSLIFSRGASYDYSAFLYFAWRAYLKKFHGQEIPKSNAWDSKGFLCTEMVGVADKICEILGYGSLLDDKIDLAITAPIDLYYLLETKASRSWTCY